MGALEVHVVVVSVNYKTADVAMREKLAFKDNEIENALVTLSNKKSILECVILSTCNRTEVYAVVDQLHTGKYYIQSFLADWFEQSLDTIKEYTNVLNENDAIEHLFKVTSGLDSMVLGETQILGQMKDAFQIAQEEVTTGTMFNRLFKQAITLAKRAHHETDIASNAVSVSYAAVELSKKVLGRLDNKKALIIGAGEMAELAVANLNGSGVTDITVINRTAAKAESLAMQYSGVAKSINELQCSLMEADIVISSTSADQYILTKEMMNDVERFRRNKPLVLIDIAVPRDIDPAVNELELMYNYDVDDLNGLVDANLGEREKAAREIELLIAKEIDKHEEWVNMLGVVPVISALRDKASHIQQDTMVSIERKLPDMTDRERKVISKHMKSIVNQLLKDPITQAKELSTDKKSKEKLELFQEIFNITEEVERFNETKKEKNKVQLQASTIEP
ncbi:glutamyl-tRNA reductase [Mammaliicoccus stepanovicii]|uniref:Glutamyl-tRNA reductase n=1 Tax=Mammaliicoccus stepanovicii TaxID=643214 RepID=A0A239Z1Y1_9STAP|nr:glutamyl-tRNA reductase [Mammaliicoccus stepanovicii]